MAEFINTIDVVGDEALADSIIERTITEFKDDHVPDAIKTVLEQLHDRSDGKEGQ